MLSLKERKIQDERSCNPLYFGVDLGKKMIRGTDFERDGVVDPQFGGGCSLFLVWLIREKALATMARVFSLMWIGTWEGGRLGNRKSFGFEDLFFKK